MMVRIRFHLYRDAEMVYDVNVVATDRVSAWAKLNDMAGRKGWSYDAVRIVSTEVV